MAEVVVKLTDKNYETEVKQSKIPVVVDCYADWCGPCKMFAPIFELVALAYRGKVKFCKMNVEEAGDIPASMGIFSVPTTLFLKGGEEVERVAGAMDEHKFKHRVETLLKA